MSPKFGKTKKDGGTTIALLDIENGSVGAALARLVPDYAPRLFGEIRVTIPLLNTRDTDAMTREIEKAAREALRHVSEVAARIRLHDILAQTGEVERTAAFLSPPWAAMHLVGGTADYAPHMPDLVQGLIQDAFGDKHATLHPFGTAVAHGAVALFPEMTPAMLCIVNGEVTELLVIAENTLVGRATIPMGLHSLLRTLTSHGGLSAAEARSLLALGSRTPHAALQEPISAVQAHFAREFGDVAKALLERAPVQHVFVLAPHAAEEWFARALAQDESLTQAFPEGSTVRALRAQHMMPYLSAHAPKPDLPLMLEALFVDAKFSGI